MAKYGDIYKFEEEFPSNEDQSKVQKKVVLDIIKKNDNFVMAAPSIYFKTAVDEILKEDIIPIELIDSVENIFDRFVLSDKNEQEYKMAHKEQYLYNIYYDTTASTEEWQDIPKFDIAGLGIIKATDKLEKYLKSGQRDEYKYNLEWANVTGKFSEDRRHYKDKYLEVDYVLDQKVEVNLSSTPYDKYEIYVSFGIFYGIVYVEKEKAYEMVEEIKKLLRDEYLQNNDFSNEFFDKFREKYDLTLPNDIFFDFDIAKVSDFLDKMGNIKF